MQPPSVDDPHAQSKEVAPRASAPAAAAKTPWRRKSALFVFLASAASLGLYNCWWVFDLVRRRPETSLLCSHPRALGWISVAPVMVALVIHRALIEFDDEEGRKTAGRLLVPLAMGVASFGLGLSAAGELLTSSAVLLALPVAWTQSRINGHARASVETTSHRGRVAGLVGLALALGGFVLLAWSVDRGTLAELRSVALLGGERVQANDGSLSIRSPGSGWALVPSGTIGEEDSLIELAGPQGVSWLIVYAFPRQESLQDLAYGRRAAIFESAKPSSVSEKIVYADDETLERGLRGSYEFGDSALIDELFDVWIVESGPRVVEMIAYTSRRKGDRPDFDASFRSLEVVEASGE